MIQKDDARILFITDCYYTDESGSKTSAKLHLKTLNKLYKNVDVVALVGSKEINHKEDGHIVFEGIKNKILLFFNCVVGYPTYLSQNICNKIVNLVITNKYDVIFVDNSILGVLIKKIKTRTNIPIISYYHDVKASLAREWMKNAPLIKKPVYISMVYNESLTAKYSDVNLVLNDREKLAYIKYYKKEPEGTLPVYLDIEYKEVKKRVNDNNNVNILFFGGGYGPNINGIKWFVDNVFDNIDFNAILTIAGREMDKHFSYLKHDRINVVGYVNDIGDLYQHADIVVSPIFEGGGMKVKVAEAMGYGKIIIATNESFEGYGINIPDDLWNHYFYRANTSEEFINALNNAYASKLYLGFSTESRKIFEENYSTQHAEKIIRNIILKFTE